MRYFSLLAVVGSALAQSSNMSLCDKYTTALLKTNNATTQYTLLTLLVNTVVIGNYTMPNMNAVPGILAPGTFNGASVNLLPYFNGGLASSNRGGQMGVAINFLDDGGAAPLMMNKPSNGMTSNQYFLLTHLYQFFGKLLGCSGYGMMGFPAYSGKAMGPVHNFMNLDPNQLGYFITQVGLAAASFGVSKDDITTVATALNKLFGYRCSPPAVVIPEQGATLNSICINSACPLDPMANCSAYPNNGVALVPMKANMSSASGSATMSMGGATMTMMPSSTGMLPPMASNPAPVMAAGMQLVAAGMAVALML